MRRITVVALWAALLVACNDSTSPAKASYTLSPARQWSGGTVRVVSAVFVGSRALPAIFANGLPLTAQYLDDSTLAVQLPQAPSGPLTLRRGNGDSVATVQVYGYSTRDNATPGFGPGEELRVAQNGLEPVVIGEGTGAPPNPGLVVLYPGAGAFEVHTGLKAPGGYYGVGPAALAGQFMLKDSTDTTAVWQLWPTPQRLAVPPLFQTGFVRHAAQLTDSTWLFATSHMTNTVGPSSVSGLPTEDSWALFQSPRGDRAAMALVGTTLPGAPVFDALTGDTAFTLTGLHEVQWAGFSPSGDRLFLLAQPSYVPNQHDSLLVVDATNGQWLAGIGLPDTAKTKTLAIDPAANLLYVQSSQNCLPRVRVFDRTTLALVGDLVATGTTPICDNNGWEGALAIDRGRNKAYVVWLGEPAPTWTFDLLP